MQFQISYRRESEWSHTWVIKVRVLRKIFGKQICCIRCKRTPRVIKSRRCSRFTFFENTISNSPKVTRARFLGDDRHFFFISISKFSSFKYPHVSILTWLNFTVDSKDLFCSCKWKKWFLWAMTAVQAAENHGDGLGLTWHGICTSIPTWPTPKMQYQQQKHQGTPHGTSDKWSRRPSQSARE